MRARPFNLALSRVCDATSPASGRGDANRKQSFIRTFSGKLTGWRETPKQRSRHQRLDEHWQKRLREAAFLLLLPLAIYLLACLLSYSPTDPGWSHVGEPEHIHNFGGAFGAWIADLSFYLLGIVAYALPLLLLGIGAVILRGAVAVERSPLEPTLRLIGFVAFFIAGSGLAHLHMSGTDDPAGRRGRHPRPARRRRPDERIRLSSARACSCWRCFWSR